MGKIEFFALFDWNGQFNRYKNAFNYLGAMKPVSPDNFNHFSYFALPPGGPTGVQKGVCLAKNKNFSHLSTILINLNGCTWKHDNRNLEWIDMTRKMK